MDGQNNSSLLIVQGDGESVPVTPPNETARQPAETVERRKTGNSLTLRLELDAVVTTLLVVGLVTRFFRLVSFSLLQISC